jgi:hypothetical protein
VKLSDVCRVVAAETNQPDGRIKMLARRLQEINAIPKGPGGRIAPDLDWEHVAVLLFAMLVDRVSPMAARIAAAMANYRDIADDMPSTTAAEYVGRLLSNADFSHSPKSVLAFNSSLTVHGGAQEAVVVRTTCTDTPLETAFVSTEEPYRPELAETIVSAFTLPGVLLHRIGRALNEVR